METEEIKKDPEPKNPKKFSLKAKVIGGIGVAAAIIIVVVTYIFLKK